MIGGEIQLDCSESNIRIGYLKNLGFLQHDASDIISRSLREIRLECNDQVCFYNAVICYNI
jgi:hypothetical protein